MNTARQRSSSASSTKRKSQVATPPAVLPQTPALLPAAGDQKGWRAYWQTQGQLWRTEPEIDQKRQAELEQRRTIVPDVEKGIYPFKDMELSRADVEWLLATHENGRGAVYIHEEKQYKRFGLDLRGANLEKVDLKRLPLARVRFGLPWDEWIPATKEQRERAACSLKEANLSRAHLEGAYLNNVCLEKADCTWAYLGAANLAEVHLEGAYLNWAHLEEAQFENAHLERCNFGGAFLGAMTSLRNMYVSSEQFGTISLGDVSWGRANLSVVNWASIKMLGNELKARKTNQLEDYQTAVRAYRQLAVALQEQGVNEEADRFAYRAQVLQKKVFQLHMIQSRILLKLCERHMKN